MESIHVLSLCVTMSLVHAQSPSCDDASKGLRHFIEAVGEVVPCGNHEACSWAVDDLIALVDALGLNVKRMNSGDPCADATTIVTDVETELITRIQTTSNIQVEFCEKIGAILLDTVDSITSVFTYI